MHPSLHMLLEPEFHQEPLVGFAPGTPITWISFVHDNSADSKISKLEYKFILNKQGVHLCVHFLHDTYPKQVPHFEKKYMYISQYLFRLSLNGENWSRKLTLKCLNDTTC